MNTVLSQLAPLLAGPSLVEDVITRLAKCAADVSGSSEVRLFRIDRARHELHCRMANGADVYEIRVPAGRGLHGQVVKNQEIQRGRSPETGAPLSVVPVFSQTASPDRAREVIAVLEFANRNGGQSFEAEDEGKLTGVADHVARVLAHARLDDSRRAPGRITEVIGNSDAMLALYSQIQDVAASDVPVTLVGAHGSGKSLIARVIHHLGPRRNRALTSLRNHSESYFLEAELFGVPGAEEHFQGAIQRAQGSTLLVEQLASLPDSSQARLLQLASQLEVRLIITHNISCATNSNHEVSRGPWADSFQAQTLNVPTLAERGPDDITSLARHFVREQACRLQVPDLSIDDKALARLRSQPWPGNVQELEKCIQSAVLSCDGQAIGLDDLCLPGAAKGGAPSDSIPSGLLLADAEERYILRTLTENQENRTRTASSLGIGRNTLVRKIKQYRNK
jgi:DNA-binding NtrC family response regulator